MNKFSEILDTCKLAINVHYPDAVLSIYTNKKRGIVNHHLRKNLRYMQHDESTGIMCYTIFR